MAMTKYLVTVRVKQYDDGNCYSDDLYREYITWAGSKAAAINNIYWRENIPRYPVAGAEGYMREYVLTAEEA